MPPDEEKDVDDIFGESMFNDDDEDALNDDAPHENVAVDNSANLTASDETPDHEDDFGGMVDLSDEDGLYGNMIGDEDGEDHNGAVEDLSMVDIIDDEDDEEQANLTRDENAVSAFSQGVDSRTSIVLRMKILIRCSRWKAPWKVLTVLLTMILFNLWRQKMLRRPNLIWQPQH